MVTIPESGNFGIASAPASSLFNDPVLMRRYRLAQMLAQPQPVHPIRTGVEALATALQPIIGAYTANKLDQQVAARRDAYNTTLAQASQAPDIETATKILTADPDTAPMAAQFGVKNMFESATARRALANQLRSQGLNPEFDQSGNLSRVTAAPNFGAAQGGIKGEATTAETPALVTQGYALNPVLAQRAGMTTGAEHAAALPYAFGEAAARAGGAASGTLPYVGATEQAKAAGQFAGLFGGAPFGTALPASAIPGAPPSAAPGLPPSPQGGAAPQSPQGTPAPGTPKSTAPIDLSKIGASIEGPEGSQLAAPPIVGANEKFLQTLPPALQPVVKGIAEGRIALPQRFLGSPQGMALLSAANQYDPTLDASNYANRLATRKAFSQGQYSQSITAANTALHHAGRALDNAAALNNIDTPILNLLNAPINATLERTSPDFKGRLNAFRTDVNAFASELERAWRGTGGSEQGIQEWRKTLNENDPPSAQAAAIKEGVKLLEGRVDELANAYNRGMNTNATGIQMLSPDAQAVYSKIVGAPPPGAMISTQRNGQAPTQAPTGPTVSNW